MHGSGEGVTVYGADWCPATQATRRWLDTQGVAHSYVNVERDPAASEWVKAQNNGMELKPTLQVGGTVLGAPESEALAAALRQRGLL